LYALCICVHTYVHTVYGNYVYMYMYVCVYVMCDNQTVKI